MEDLEDTQDFDKYYILDSVTPDSGKHFSDYESDESVAEWGGKSNSYFISYSACWHSRIPSPKYEY